MRQREDDRSGIAGALRRFGGRHLRLTVVTTALLLVVAGAAGGYAGFRPTDRSSALADGQNRSPDAASAIGRAPAGPSAAGASGGSAGSGSDAIACPMVGGPVDSSNGENELNQASHLFTRTTTDGVTIRTYRLSSGGSCGCGATPSLSVEMSDTSAVGQGVLYDSPGPVATTANATSEPIASTAGAFGVTEGAPVWWTAVQVGPDVAKVTMTLADGSTDQMTPVDGVAVLAGQIDEATASEGDGPYEVRGTMRLLDADGTVVKTVTFPAAASTPVPLPVSVPGSPPTGVSSNAMPLAGGTADTALPTCAVAVPPGVAAAG
ncbi:MAG TPA: hypothetical protein VIJ09_03110 [Acidimicrobiales bacterium]